MSNQEFTLKSNVHIQVRDKYGKTLREEYVHNKATSGMVQGILKFLKGDFGNFGTLESQNPDDYIPDHIEVGRVGVKISETDPPLLETIDNRLQKTPGFTDSSLQDKDTMGYFYNITGKSFHPDTITIGETNDVNDSRSLILKTYIPTGDLVGYGKSPTNGSMSSDPRFYFTTRNLNAYYSEPGHTKPFPTKDVKGWVFSSGGKYTTLITELGLFSKNGTLLARLLFNGAVNIDSTGLFDFDDDRNPLNPIVQTDETSLIIEWNIGIVSVGSQDDYVVVANTLENNIKIGDPNDDNYREQKEYSIAQFKELEKEGSLFYGDLSYTREEIRDGVTKSVNYGFKEFGGGFVLWGSRLKEDSKILTQVNSKGSLTEDNFYIDVARSRIYLNHQVKINNSSKNLLYVKYLAKATSVNTN